MKAIILLSFLANFLGAHIFSLQAPFFPREAAIKNISSTEYGFVFGVYSLTCLVSSLFYGSHFEYIGTRFGLCAGLLVSSTSCICFGMLSMMKGRATFLTFAIFIRIMEALGQSLFFVSNITLIMAASPQTASQNIGLLQTASSVGIVISPAVGGLLFELGGFPAPFLYVGLLLYLCLSVALCIVPEMALTPKKSASKGVGASLIKLRGIHLGILCVSTATFTSGFLNATLEPHLRKFNLPPSYIGLLFTVVPLSFGSTSWMVGRFIDKGFDPKLLMLVGCILKILAFAFIGPFPWIPIESSIPLIITGLVLNGLSHSGQIITGYGQMNNTVESSKFHSLEEARPFIASFLQGTKHIGLGFGSFMGGMFLQYTGFRIGVLSIVLLNISTFVFALIMLREKRTKSEETTELL